MIPGNRLLKVPTHRRAAAFVFLVTPLVATFCPLRSFGEEAATDGAAAAAVTGEKPDGGEVGSRPSGFDGEVLDINLPPFIESRRLRSGAVRESLLMLYHRTVEPSGKLYSWHIGPYMQGPDYKLLLPFLYSVGEGESRRRGAVPFYFEGPRYRISPPFMSFWWRHADDSESTWITPLFHVNRDPAGRLRHMHAFTYFRGQDYEFLLPLAFKVGPPGNEHAGVIPFYFRGPGWQVSPLALAAWWKKADGSDWTWVTPFYHRKRGPDGELEHMHAFNYFAGPGYKVLFPLAYKVGEEGREHTGVIPFYFSGPGYMFSPPALAASWRNADGSRSTWVTPFFHSNRDREGRLTDMHLLSYFQGRDYKVLFPLAYSVGPEGRRHRGIIPFYFDGPGYRSVPLALSGQWKNRDGTETTVITPLFHANRNADGSLRDMHLANYFQGPGYKLFVPIGYSVGEKGREHSGVIPFYFSGPGYKVSPPLLSGRWKNRDGSETTVVTPLYHRTNEPDGSLREMHVVNYFAGKNHRVFFPFAYSFRTEEGVHRGLVPFYFERPGRRLYPLVLSASFDNPDGSETTWITPLIHRTREPDGSLRDVHVLNYFAGKNYEAIVPFWYTVGKPGSRHSGLVPFYFQGPGYKAAPLALTAWWKERDGSDALWITPAFHLSNNQDGTLKDMHLANYFQGKNYKVLFPFGYSVGEPGRRHQGVIPFYFQGPGYKAAPLALSAWWKEPDGSDTAWVTPFFHRTRSRDGRLKSMHLLNYLQTEDYKLLFPLAYKTGTGEGSSFGVLPFYFGGPGYRVSPPTLSGWWKNADGSETTMITPLFHRTNEADGSLRDTHLLTYAQGRDYKILFPLGYSVGEPGKRHQGVVPFYFRGPGYEVAPLALSGRWRGPGGSETTMITPLFHRTLAADGTLRHMHLLNYVQAGDSRLFLPFGYSFGRPGRRHAGVIPFYFQGPGWKVSPPALSGWWRNRDGSEDLWVTPLFHRRTGPDGRLEHMHCLTYFQGRNYRVGFPLYYSFGERGSAHSGLIPFLFRGPGYAVSPLLLSAWIRHSDGEETTWFTPLYHETRSPTGELRHQHIGPFFNWPRHKVLFPVWWQWRTDDGGTRAVVPLLYSQKTSADGAEVYRSILPPLFAYHRGPELDTSLPFQLRPFSYQRAGRDWEFNFLWMPKISKQGASTSVTVGPLWSSSRPAPGVPAAFQVLGGLLFGRAVNYERGTYRYRILGILRVGPRRHFDPVPGVRGSDRAFRTGERAPATPQ